MNMKEHEHPYWNKGNFPKSSDKDLSRMGKLYYGDTSHKSNALGSRSPKGEKMAEEFKKLGSKIHDEHR